MDTMSDSFEDSLDKIIPSLDNVRSPTDVIKPAFKLNQYINLLAIFTSNEY